MKKYKDFPKEIRNIIKQRVEEQGNPFNLDTEYGDNIIGGGFDWNISPEGDDFWSEVLGNEDFSIFYKKYPEEKDSITKSVKKNLEGQKFSQDKLPIYTLVCKQFPLAIQEVAKSTLGGHKKYISTDAKWDNFSKVKDPQFQYLNAAMRHLIEAESHTFNEDMKEYGDIRHKAQAIWNLMASLELEMREIHKRYEKSEIPEDIDKVPLTKEECFPTEPVICETTKEQREKLNELRKLDESESIECSHQRMPKFESRALKEAVKNARKQQTYQLKGNWDRKDEVKKDILNVIDYFSRPTLSVDQLLNQEDEYPDFVDNEIS